MNRVVALENYHFEIIIESTGLAKNQQEMLNLREFHDICIVSKYLPLNCLSAIMVKLETIVKKPDATLCL